MRPGVQPIDRHTRFAGKFLHFKGSLTEGAHLGYDAGERSGRREAADSNRVKRGGCTAAERREFLVSVPSLRMPSVAASMPGDILIEFNVSRILRSGPDMLSETQLRALAFRRPFICVSRQYVVRFSGDFAIIIAVDHTLFAIVHLPLNTASAAARIVSRLCRGRVVRLATGRAE